MKKYLHWTLILPVLAWAIYFAGLPYMEGWPQLIVGLFLAGSILSAVHHAEEIAHKVGEPYGTVILAIAITTIEVALIVSIMLTSGEKAIYLARDTIFASVMILLTAVMGICMIVGSLKHREQRFQNKSVNIALVSLVTILALTLVLPNFTTSIAGPTYTTKQLIFVAIACMVIYGTFLGMQTIRHRGYFVSIEDDGEEHGAHVHGEAPPLAVSLVALLVCLGIVVLLAKSLSPTIEQIVADAELPKSIVGIIIAGLVLLPEGIAAVRAAAKNDIQSSINLSLGSALAAIGLTIPAVAIVCSMYDLRIFLGLEDKSLVFLALSVYSVMLALRQEKTNLLYGVVLLVIFVAFIFTTIFP